VPCTCSEYQLYQVGCDCEASYDAVVVHVWKDGYASDNKGKLYIEGGLNVEAEVRKVFGSFAKVYHSYKPNQGPARSIPDSQRQDTRKDNS
jgi:hypothetical protein